LRVAYETGALRTNDLKRVTVDTTVRPKVTLFRLMPSLRRSRVSTGWRANAICGGGNRICAHAAITHSQQHVRYSVMRERLPSVARPRSSKPFCARRVCFRLEQAEETTGVGWSIIVTRYVSRGNFTEAHA
jgi:hypothetical protein